MKRKKKFIIDLTFEALIIMAAQGLIWAFTPFLSHLTSMEIILQQAGLFFPYMEMKYVFWPNTLPAFSIMLKLVLTLLLVFNFLPMFLVSVVTRLPISDLRKSNKYTRLYWRFKSPIYYLYLPIIFAVWIIFPFMGKMAGFLYWLFATENNFHTWILLSIIFAYSTTVLFLSWRNHLRSHCPECGTGIVIRQNDLIICNTCLTMYRLPKDTTLDSLYDYHEDILSKAKRIYPNFRKKPVSKTAEFHSLYPREAWTQFMDTLFNREDK